MVSTSGLGIEFQSKTLRSTGALGLTVMCEDLVESLGGWSREGGTGHVKVGTEPWVEFHPWSTYGLDFPSESTSGERSEICLLRSPLCETSESGERIIALPQISVCLCPMELRARGSGDGFGSTENDEPDSWTDVTGIADVSVNAMVVFLLKEEPVSDEGWIPSEWR